MGRMRMEASSLEDRLTFGNITERILNDSFHLNTIYFPKLQSDVSVKRYSFPFIQ